MPIGKRIGSKLSVQTFGWDKSTVQEAVLKDKNADVFLMRAAGIVTGLKPYKDKESGETRYGCLGQFEVTSGQGETENGTVLYLPSYVQDLINSAFSSSEVESIRIGFDIYAQFNEKSATSYAFVVNDILNEGNSAMDDVKASVDKIPLPGTPAAMKLEDKTSK